MLEDIQKKVEDIRIKVYAGQNNEETERCLYEIEQMIFKAMDIYNGIYNVLDKK